MSITAEPHNSALRQLFKCLPQTTQSLCQKLGRITTGIGRATIGAGTGWGKSPLGIGKKDDSSNGNGILRPPYLKA
ncbi:hypothetical protein H6F61_24350 [Cyanobacteria bacterium FACHB-472]|nr:hypothetical protein [Cyanobacteria bacterium FACHB-472]